MSEEAQKQQAVVVERVVDAPVALVWQLWTSPDHFKQWYGPRGFHVPVAEWDVRVGGQRRVCMAMIEGDMTMWTIGEFTEIVENEKLVYTESMADDAGNVLPSPDPSMAETTTVTVLFEAMGDQTKMTLTHAGVPAGQGGAESGWSQAFDKLAELIPTLNES